MCGAPLVGETGPNFSGSVVVLGGEVREPDGRIVTVCGDAGHPSGGSPWPWSRGSSRGDPPLWSVLWGRKVVGATPCRARRTSSSRWSEASSWRLGLPRWVAYCALQVRNCAMLLTLNWNRCLYRLPVSSPRLPTARHLSFWGGRKEAMPFGDYGCCAWRAAAWCSDSAAATPTEQVMPCSSRLIPRATCRPSCGGCQPEPRTLEEGLVGRESASTMMTLRK